MVKGTKMEIQYYRNNNIHKNKMITNLILIYKKQLKNLMVLRNKKIVKTKKPKKGERKIELIDKDKSKKS